MTYLIYLDTFRVMLLERRQMRYVILITLAFLCQLPFDLSLEVGFNIQSRAAG
jgi:hypothetical protein